MTTEDINSLKVGDIVAIIINSNTVDHYSIVNIEQSKRQTIFAMAYLDDGKTSNHAVKYYNFDDLLNSNSCIYKRNMKKKLMICQSMLI